MYLIFYDLQMQGQFSKARLVASFTMLCMLTYKKYDEDLDLTIDM